MPYVNITLDVGAAINPLVFDLDTDVSQLAIYVEPAFWKQLEPRIEGARLECIRLYETERNFVDYRGE